MPSARNEQRVKQAKATATSLRLDDVAGRYWQEVGQHHAGARNTERQLGYLIEFFGRNKLITDITDDDVAKLVAWRRGHRTRGGTLISAYTVNDLTEQLRQLIGRCQLWGVQFTREPQWRRHKLSEPQERVRELVGDEGERLAPATRGDYVPFFAFARASGLRLKECLLRWSEVDFGTRQITKTGKGGKRVTVPITSAIRDILWPLQGHHADAVFTYVAQRDIDKVIKGKRYQFVAGARYPITYSGVATAWRRLRQRAGVHDFRFHDHRHDLGTKVLRDTGNLKLVQKALNHSSIRSTVRYAHVLDEDVAVALERYQNSRKNPRKLRDKKVS